MTQTEGNKVISEFLEWEVSDDLVKVPRLYEYLTPWFGKEPAIDIDYVTMRLDQLEFHSSWGWLMPVVEKIEAIEDKHHGHFGVHIMSNGCTIQATNLRTDNPIVDPPHYFNDVTLDTKIQSTWYAVVQFIQWYNSQPK